jgi:hypothetical protein
VWRRSVAEALAVVDLLDRRIATARKLAALFWCNPHRAPGTFSSRIREKNRR